MPPGLPITWVGAPRIGGREYSRRRWASLRTGEPADVSRVEAPVVLTALRAALA